jgi:hypothetical protein
MTDGQNDKTHRAAEVRRRWAPWWIYLVVILGGNYLRQAIVPFGTVPVAVDVALAVSIAAILFLVVTATYRALARTR